MSISSKLQWKIHYYVILYIKEITYGGLLALDVDDDLDQRASGVSDGGGHGSDLNGGGHGGGSDGGEVDLIGHHNHGGNSLNGEETSGRRDGNGVLEWRYIIRIQATFTGYIAMYVHGIIKFIILLDPKVVI